MRRLLSAALLGVFLTLPGPAAPAVAVVPQEIATDDLVVKPALPAAHLGPMKHVRQTLNNCGPAAVVMALSTLGIDESQEVARLAMRGPDVRRGMGPTRVGPWVDERFGLKAMWRFSGTNELMKQLVTNGFAPMVTQWMVDPNISRISHWRVVRGYDDAKGVFYVNDSMLGNNVPLTYGWFDQNWLAFGYRYMVIFQPEDEPLLRAIIGEHWDDYTMRKSHYQRMKAAALAQGTSAAWIAYGEAAYQFGLFEESIVAIEKGLDLGTGTGLFMLRTSLPNAYRALGRFDEADAAQERLRGITPGVSPATSSVTGSETFRLDPLIAIVVAERERHQRILLMKLMKLEGFGP
jgi:hypothetical protein